MTPTHNDFYGDDPVEVSSNPAKRKISGVIALVLLLIGGTYLVQTTLAANIALNSGGSVEFGQGVTATAACSGAINLTITPNSTFTNVSGGGAHYFSSVTVSNIPSDCNGKDFTINAYGTSDSTPLALFNSTSKNVVAYSNAGTFELGVGTTSGASIISGSGTFTITFTNPVATSGSVFKVTLQSSSHTVFTTSYNVGDAGPGGGIIFFKDNTGFSCGNNFAATGSPTGGLCNYLEAAPSGWNTGVDPALIWAVSSFQTTDVANAYGITNDDWSPSNTSATIGLGYKNSFAIVTQNSAGNTYAAGLARAYSGGSKSDWYLPTSAEMNLLCQWNRGITQNVTTACSGGTINSGTGASGSGFISGYYWSSSESNGGNRAWRQSFYGDGGQDSPFKSGQDYVRPIRAF
jgi:hypothetical protein